MTSKHHNATIKKSLLIEYESKINSCNYHMPTYEIGIKDSEMADQQYYIRCVDKDMLIPVQEQTSRDPRNP